MQSNRTNTFSKFKLVKSLILGLLIATIFVVIMYPVFMNNNRLPRWVRESYKLMRNISKAIKIYSDENEGIAPKSLNELYPKYTNDIRVKKRYLLLGGEEVLVNYKKPIKLGNRYEVILDIKLNRKATEKDYQRPVRLYGDLHAQTIM